MTGKASKYSLPAVIVMAATLVGPLCSGQAVCPVQFESVLSQPLSAGLESSNYVLKVTYRNTSGYTIKGILFDTQIGSTVLRTMKPAALVSYHTVIQGAEDTVQWDESRYVRQVTANPSVVIWVDTIMLADGSSWGDSGTTHCSYHGPSGSDVALRIDDSATRASTTAMNDRVAALPQTSVANTGLASRPLKAADKMELIASGRASLCLISTVPAGATIDVDGKKVGVTPMSLVLLKGDHGARSVDIYREGYSIIHHDLEPTGQTIALNDKLVALTSHP
jgi:hypothetical protein